MKFSSVWSFRVSDEWDLHALQYLNTLKQLPGFTSAPSRRRCCVSWTSCAHLQRKVGTFVLIPPDSAESSTHLPQGSNLFSQHKHKTLTVKNASRSSSSSSSLSRIIYSCRAEIRWICVHLLKTCIHIFFCL